MVTAVIAQARYGSRRLPGKVLEALAGVPVMIHTLRRAKAIAQADTVVLATTTKREDDPVAKMAEDFGFRVFRGAEDDVLDRYREAARSVAADVIMRVTCDCPLLDPEVCEAVLDLRSRRGLAYASNVASYDWPHGLDCEAFTREILETAAESANDPAHREHVTLWMREAPDIPKAHLTGPGGAAVTQRWTLDYPEDLAFLNALFEHLPQAPAMPGWEEVMAVVRAHPEIEAINRQRVAAERAA